ncbi:hypothetical protein HU200_000493 [Digitaria exilis]|uniref:Uncharacterized protein n=1 Tax=Digitaria exilis TaxID=1010633 RepID=A0A835KWQ6_9POAL|nr:hypothetical protein HU200_000493 [Digitaria exilis]
MQQLPFTSRHPPRALSRVQTDMESSHPATHTIHDTMHKRRTHQQRPSGLGITNQFGFRDLPRPAAPATATHKTKENSSRPAPPRSSPHHTRANASAT